MNFPYEEPFVKPRICYFQAFSQRKESGLQCFNQLVSYGAL